MTSLRFGGHRRMRLTNRTPVLAAACASALICACGGDDFASDGAGGTPSSAGPGGSTASTGGATASGSGGAPPGECDEEGAVCVPAAPEGWQGPIAAYVGEQPAPDCGDGWSTDLDAFAGGVSGDVSCSACVCGGADGAGCGVPDLGVYSASNCGTKILDIILQPNTCKQLANYDYMNRGPVPVIAGSCAPSGGGASPTEPVWEQYARLCRWTSNDSCDAGVCQAAPGAGYHWPCFFQEGEHACPGDLEQQTIQVSATDTRSCSSCACGTPTGGQCEGTVWAYPTSCNVNGVSVADAPNCSIDLSDGFAYAKYVPGLTVPGTCAPSGGQPEGTITPAEPVTVCCAR